MDEKQTEQIEQQLAGRRIVVAVTGGIAAYKACELVSTLVQEGAEVRVVMTSNARWLVGTATFRALSGYPVACDMFTEPTDGEMEHISLAEFGEVVAVVPATANLLGKVAAGVCDDLVTTTICATDGPVVIASAMNQRMWENPLVQRNYRLLEEVGYYMIPPESGYLACGEEGIGRLANLETILNTIGQALTESAIADNSLLLVGKRVLVTAGPTREHLDPVRFISNPSSGKMGFALARAARAAGAQVTLVSGPTALKPPVGVELVGVESAEQMHAAVMDRLAGIDVFIGAAAVANYTPQAPADQKIPSSEQGLTINLAPTPHILGDVATCEHRPPVVVGFAAETDKLMEKATEKLQDHGLDLLVANDLTAPGAGFTGDTNQVIIIRADGSTRDVGLLPKDKIAQIIMEETEKLLPSE